MNPAYKIRQLSQRQDSLREQMADVHVAATRLGCYDAADAIWKHFLESAENRRV